MKAAIMHYDLPETNWYAGILRKYTYGSLAQFGIEHELIFQGGTFPDQKDDTIDIIDFSEWNSPWQQQVARKYSNHLVCTTAEVSVNSLKRYLHDNKIDVKFMLSKIERFIARSSWTKNMLTGFGIPGDKIDVIHYGADLDTFRPGKEPETPAFLYVGSINRQKGIHHLVNAYLKIIDKTDWTLKLCVGEWNNDPVLVKELESLSRENKKIQLLPFPSLDKLIEVYYGATCFCHIQDFNSPAQCSNPGIWAAGCGLPLISFDRGVFKDYIQNGENGYLCRTVSEVSEKMLELSRRDWKQMGSISRKIAERDHSSVNIAVKYKNTYETVLNRVS